MAALRTAAAAVLAAHLLFRLASGATPGTDFLYPNFTASVYQFVNYNGVFLSSRNATFNAVVYKPGQQAPGYYLAVIHAPSNTVVWSANRASPIPIAGAVTLTPSALSVSSSNSSVVWSTPRFPSPIASLRLLDTGNLLLLDANNATIWQSFDYPSDTLISGQELPSGSSIIGSVSNTDFSEGDYRLTVTADDAVLRWAQQQYWSISTSPSAVKDYSSAVSYMAMNDTGLYLFSGDGKVVYEVTLPAAGFRILSLDSSGRLRIDNYANASSKSSYNEFVVPASDCDLPSLCKALELCTVGTGSTGTDCRCPNSLTNSKTGDCAPPDGSTLARCSGSGSGSGSSAISYLSLGSGIDYFANKFANPATKGGNLSSCRSLCSGNCSCIGFFYKSASQSCYVLKDPLGALVSSSTSDGSNITGYIKTTYSDSTESGNSSNTSKMGLLAILLPSIAATLLVVVMLAVGTTWWRRAKKRRFNPTKEVQLGRHKSVPASRRAALVDGSTDGDDEDILIPGLPARFSYAELEAATNGFRTKIGSGGFGTVFKGSLPDNTTVAVKRIDGVGVQGRREFCAEIAVIGNVHHVNLVRLRGFCAEGTRRLLVYEYMNRGSLDRTLFGPGPALEWGERLEVAIGAARGLAYLHAGCEQRIVHCDVKPENILLHDGGHAKIADFGLAKLLTPEQSGLFTTMRGTRGYLAPEWLTNSAISDKTDVYSYGMVLLEIVRGRKNRSSESATSELSPEFSYFPLVALELHERRRYVELADPRLEGRVTAEEVGRVVRVALCCLHEEPGMRPGMMAVTGMLEGTMDVWEPRVEALGFLRLYGRGFGEASPAEMESIPASLSAAAMDSNPASLSPAMTSSTSTTSGSLSYLTSQQVSGPR